MSVALNQPMQQDLKAKDSSIKVPVMDNLWHSANVVIECKASINFTQIGYSTLIPIMYLFNNSWTHLKLTYEILSYIKI